MTAPTRKQMHLAAHFPGVNNTTVWTDPRSKSQIEFSSFEHLARTAERGRFDFFFLAEGLRLREHKGRIHDLDVVGRPESLTVLSALAAVTDRLGLAATVNATFNEPYELARRLATLDHLSDGRAAWNVVTSSDAFTGENFRRGGYLDRADLPELSDPLEQGGPRTPGPPSSSPPPASCGTPGPPTEPRAPSVTRGSTSPSRASSPSRAPRKVTRSSSRPGTPRRAASSPRPPPTSSSPGTAPWRRAAPSTPTSRRGWRSTAGEPEDLKIMPGVTFVLGDSDAEAQESAAEIRRQQISPQNAILALEQVWGRDLSSYDPDGPLPEIDPDPDSGLVQGRVRIGHQLAVAARWRALSEAKGLSIRQTVIETTGRQSFIGRPETVASELIEFVSTDAADGFILVPHLTPGGLDEFVDRVVPLLQERGAFRSEYTGLTLRSHLGLADPVGKD